MADQLNKIRMDAQEKLRKEAEVVVEPAKPSLLQQSTADYLSKKEEPHPLSPVQNLNEGKMSQLHLYIKQGKTAKEIAKLMGVDPKTIQKLMAAYESRDAKNESVDLDEAEGSIIIPKTAPSDAIHSLVSLSKKRGLKVTSQEKRKDGGTTIQLKGNQRAILDIQGAVASKKGYKTEETLDEREKGVRQLINPTKEVMVVKKNKVVVIDKKDQDKYMKQGWSLAEETELEEARWKVKIEGLPPIYMDSSSAGEVKSQLRKLIKKPDMIQDIERVTDAEVKKAFRDKASGKEVEEAKLIDKPTGEVLKTGSKEKMETEKKRNRDELQVKEWFKAKNIDVKVRELDESTQVYVPIGRTIPNEIREELITTQYGKMPEDVKNVKDINYGNFMENSITMNNDFWTKVLHGTKGE